MSAAAVEPAQLVRAITVDQSEVGRLATRQVRKTVPGPGEIEIGVTAVSLNRGEINRALTVTPTGARPGWDFAGVVVDDRSVPGAPATGTRIVGVVPEGAWAERIHVPAGSVAPVPDGISDAQAAALPVVGLTALYCLRKGGSLLGRKVLIDGASGGVGQTAVQLAVASGARVYAYVRHEVDQEVVAALSHAEIVVGADLEAARSHGPFHFVLDSLGGPVLSAAMTMLGRHGMCVTIGVTAGREVRFDNHEFMYSPGASLHSMIIFDELAHGGPVREDLALLVDLVSRGVLTPTIAVETSWSDVAQVARDLLTGRISGKAVLHLDG